MHFWPSTFLVLLLLLSNAGPSVNAASCKRNKQCPVSHKLCAYCIAGKYPSCTMPICISGRCGEIQVCSLELSAPCKRSSDCIRNYLCEDCKVNLGPFCVQAMCIDKKCALIEPCSIQLNNSSRVWNGRIGTYKTGFEVLFQFDCYLL